MQIDQFVMSVKARSGEMGTITEVVEEWAAETWSEPPTLKKNDDGDSYTLKFTHEGNCGDFDGFLEINNSKDTIVMYLYSDGRRRPLRQSGTDTGLF